LLPYSVVEKRAQSVWRRGIPPQLRAFVWKKAIGNKLQITREQFEVIRKSIKDYQRASDQAESGAPSASSSSSSAPVPTSPDLIVTILTEEDDPSTSSEAMSTLEVSQPQTEPIQVPTSAVVPDVVVGTPPTSESPPGSNEFVVTKPKDASHKQRIVSLHSSRKNVRKLIEMDLKRTWAKFKLFSDPNHQAYDDALTLLLAIATNNPQIGYVRCHFIVLKAVS